MQDALPRDLQRRPYKPPHPPKGPDSATWRWPRMMTPSQLLDHVERNAGPLGPPAAQRRSRAD